MSEHSEEQIVESVESVESVEEEEEDVIGIDLGTSFSVVGLYNNDSASVVIIPNENGSYLTKSRVYITEDQGLVVSDHPIKNSIEILEVKRLMGLTKLEEITDKKHILYKVSEVNGKLMIEDKYTPEDISACILKYLKNVAESYLNKTITKAVVTVPAYFNDSQRSATKQACILAGLEPIRILNEPTSAALAYGLDLKKDSVKTILVFDLGGGTFDLSLLELDSGLFKVIGTTGLTTLGGSNFDNELLEHCMTIITEDLKNFKDMFRDPKNKRPYTINNISKKQLKRLKDACISAKISLSTNLSTKISVEEILKDVDFELVITRAQFEQKCLKYFKQCISLMEQLLKDLSIQKKSISEVVLVGGSTRIPKVKEMVSNFFKYEKTIINDKIDPDQTVAYGAAIQGAILNNNRNIKDTLLIDVIPMNLGLELSDGIFSVLLKKNTQIPATTTKVFTTDVNDQKGLTIKVYEGLRIMALDNHKIGTFDLDLSYNTKEAGSVFIEITFSVDHNGILEITARDLDKLDNIIKVSLQDLNKIDKTLTKQLISDFKENAYYDEIIISNKTAQDKLICYCQELLEEFKDNPDLSAKIKETLNWSLKENDKDKVEYENKSAEVYFLIMNY
jgi:molecular chaperone DnaK (HSP70)